MKFKILKNKKNKSINKRKNIDYKLIKPLKKKN